MKCAACRTDSNYHFCESCLSWLLSGESEFIQIDLPDDSSNSEGDFRQ